MKASLTGAYWLLFLGHLTVETLGGQSNQVFVDILCHIGRFHDDPTHQPNVGRLVLAACFRKARTYGARK